jgi:hypothetical protein
MPKCNLIEGNIENEQVLCDLIVVGFQVSHSNPTFNRLEPSPDGNWFRCDFESAGTTNKEIMNNRIW